MLTFVKFSYITLRKMLIYSRIDIKIFLIPNCVDKMSGLQFLNTNNASYEKK